MTPHSPSLFSRRSWLLCLPLAFLLGGCASSPMPHDTALLGALMVERLGLMDQVAQVKQAKSLPITDPKREAELLAAMEKEGAAAGVPAAAVRGFFSGQMQAARVYQGEWLKAHPHPDHSGKPLPDLAKTVRPALDEIGKKMIGDLAAARPSHEDARLLADARQRLHAAGYSEAVIAPAMRGLEMGLR